MINSVSRALAKKEEGEKGFTLIELLVVVIIIGILAAVAIPVFLNMREGAWKTTVESDLTNAALAVEAAMTENNGSLDGLTFAPATPGVGEDIDIMKGTDTEPIGTITVSDGNKLAVESEDNTYTITGDNENITDQVLVYDSATGGLSEWDETTTGGTDPDEED